MTAEEVGQKEVAVLLVVGGINVEGGGLCASLRRHALGGGFLLREHCLQLQFAKLQVGAHTKERTGTLDERGVGGKGHIARLYQLNDFVFLSLIAQFDVLGVKVKGGIGVVVQVQVHLVAHLAIEVQVYLFVKVKRLGLPVSDGQRGVVDAFQVGTHLEFCRSLCLDAHAAGTKYLLGWSKVELHVAERELLLALTGSVLCIFFPEECLCLPVLRPPHILLGAHQHRCVEIGVSHLGAQHIASQRVVIHHLRFQVVGCLQVERHGVEVFRGYGHSALHPPPCMEQGVGDAVIGSHDAWLRLGSWFLAGIIVLRSSQSHHSQQADKYVCYASQCIASVVKGTATSSA